MQRAHVVIHASVDVRLVAQARLGMRAETRRGWLGLGPVHTVHGEYCAADARALLDAQAGQRQARTGQVMGGRAAKTWSSRQARRGRLGRSIRVGLAGHQD